MRRQRRRYQRQLRWNEFRAVAVRFAPYLRRQMARLSLALLCSIGYVVVGLLEPWPLKLALDNVILDLPLPSLLATTLPEPWRAGLPLLYLLIGAIILMAIVRGVFYYYGQLLAARAGQQIVAHVPARVV